MRKYCVTQIVRVPIAYKRNARSNNHANYVDTQKLRVVSGHANCAV